MTPWELTERTLLGYFHVGVCVILVMYITGRRDHTPLSNARLTIIPFENFTLAQSRGPFPRGIEIPLFHNIDIEENPVSQPLDSQRCLRWASNEPQDGNNANFSMSRVAYDPPWQEGQVSQIICDQLLVNVSGAVATTQDPLRCQDKGKLPLACAVQPNLWIDQCWALDALEPFKATDACRNVPIPPKPLEEDCCTRITHYANPFTLQNASSGESWQFQHKMKPQKATYSIQFVSSPDENLDQFSLTQNNNLQAQGYSSLFVDPADFVKRRVWSPEGGIPDLHLEYQPTRVPLRLFISSVKTGDLTSTSTTCTSRQTIARINFNNASTLPGAMTLKCLSEEQRYKYNWFMDVRGTQLYASQIQDSQAQAANFTLGVYMRFVTKLGSRQVCMQEKDGKLVLGGPSQEAGKEAALSCTKAHALYLLRQTDQTPCSTGQSCAGWIFYAKPLYSEPFPIYFYTGVKNQLYAKPTTESLKSFNLKLHFKGDTLNWQQGGSIEFVDRSTSGFFNNLIYLFYPNIPLEQQVVKQSFGTRGVNETDARVVTIQETPKYDETLVNATNLETIPKAPPEQKPCSNHNNVTDLFFETEDCATWWLQRVQLDPRDLNLCAEGFIHFYLERGLNTTLELGSFKEANLCLADGPKATSWPNSKLFWRYECSPMDEILANEDPTFL